MRSGECQDVIEDLVRGSVPFDYEPLFAALGVFGKGAISKSESTNRAVIIDHVSDPARVEPITSEDSHQDRDISPNLDRGCGPIQPDPWHLKHFPLAYCLHPATPDILAAPKKDPIVVNVISGWRRSRGRAYLAVGVRGALLSP